MDVIKECYSFLNPTAPMTYRNRQYDFLRILFASLVLLAHAPTLVDGNTSREILSRVTHTRVTFGAFAVDGFFLLSGFLIVRSWLSDPSWTNYLQKRLLRIAPGYIVATVLSTVIAGFVAPGVEHFFAKLGWQFYASLLILKAPHTPPVYPGQTFQVVNGSLWTIFFEFLCYLLVMAYGLLGLFRRKIAWLTATLVLFAAYVLASVRNHGEPIVFNSKYEVVRLFAAFGIGACYWLFRSRIRFRRPYALLATVLLLASTRVPALFEPALMLCGGYLLFYFGHARITWLRWMREFPDVSYGMYLYGWPVQMLLIWYFHPNPWLLFPASLALCFVLGLLSWQLVERPMLTLKKRAMAPLPAKLAA